MTGSEASNYLEHGRSRLISRNGHIFDRFDALAGQVTAALAVDDAIIDGEIIAADETGRPRFYDLLRRARAPAYVAFDLLWLDGVDLRQLPLHERRRRLRAVLPEASPILSEARCVTGRGRELFDLVCAHDLEGIVGKRAGDPYEPCMRWLKVKNRDYSQAEGRGICSTGRRGSGQERRRR